MEILHLTLKKKWFDMILAGEKKEEYREIKSYWAKRLFSKQYNTILFRNGYKKNCPQFLINFTYLTKGKGRETWGGGGAEVYILGLGDIIKVDNVLNFN